MNPVTAAVLKGSPSSRTSVSAARRRTAGRDQRPDPPHPRIDPCVVLTTPEPCIRVHANTPDSLLHHVAETVKDGKGFPKLLNDEMIFPTISPTAPRLKEALDWCVSGCCESRLPNRETNVTGNGGLDYGSAVEMTFRNGKLKVFNDVQFRVQTGDPRTWTSYDQVWKAFCVQLRHLAGHALVQQHVAMRDQSGQSLRRAGDVHADDLAMEHCRDLHTHGDYMPGALDFTLPVGIWQSYRD